MNIRLFGEVVKSWLVLSDICLVITRGMGMVGEIEDKFGFAR